MSHTPPVAHAREVGQVARIFKCAAHAVRLRILLALEPGECDTSRISHILGDLDFRRVADQLQVLYEEGLARRRTIGSRTGYSLSKAGIGVAQSFHVISDHLCLGRALPAGELPGARPSQTRPVPTRQTPRAESPQLIEAACLLNHAANPLRLRLLLTLAEGESDTDRLARELGGLDLRQVGQHLAILQSGSLVASRRHSRQHIYTLAVNGLSLVQVVRATCSRLTIRRGKLSLRPETIRAGEESALDPTTPEGLARVFKAFAIPIRLRVLNVLVSAGEVCSCHLAEALQLPRRSILESLAYPRKAGLVLDRQDRQWIFWRPSAPASNLCRSLIGCFGVRLSEAESFDADRQRLHNLASCTGSRPSEPQDVPTTGKGPGPGAGPRRERIDPRTA